jgi:predicted transcriptional regulator
MLILYESKDSIELNRPLKNKLNTLFATLSPKQKAQIVTLPIINCSGAGIFAWMWKNNLVDATKREKLTIYGNWDEQMANDFGMAEDSNIIVINRQGIIKYFRAGEVGAAEAPAIVKLLTN